MSVSLVRRCWVHQGQHSADDNGRMEEGEEGKYRFEEGTVLRKQSLASPSIKSMVMAEVGVAKLGVVQGGLLAEGGNPGHGE